jgi:hypothetical protein
MRYQFHALCALEVNIVSKAMPKLTSHAAMEEQETDTASDLQLIVKQEQILLRAEIVI